MCPHRRLRVVLTGDADQGGRPNEIRRSADWIIDQTPGEPASPEMPELADAVDFIE
ncbi:MAG: hypothetical protein OJF50_001051 [Nitrospira sp.]|nr:hypothetical protein [Nitrospira sp.]